VEGFSQNPCYGGGFVVSGAGGAPVHG